ncbi:MAG: AmiS/UreI family transporter [bacterium]
MLAVSLLFVGITLISNGALILQKSDVKSIAMMNVITAIVLVGGNFIQLDKAVTMMDYCNVGAGFLFGFTYVIITCNLLFNLDPRANGWFSGMVALFSIIMGISSMDMGTYNYAYLWFTWSVLWGSTFVEAILKKPLGNFTPMLCIAEGIFCAFIPAMMMFFEVW